MLGGGRDADLQDVAHNCNVGSKTPEVEGDVGIPLHKEPVDHRDGGEDLSDDGCPGSAGDPHAAGVDQDRIEDDICECPYRHRIHGPFCIAFPVHNRVGNLAEEEGECPEKEDPGILSGKAGGIACAHEDENVPGEEEERDGDGDGKEGHQEDRVHRDAACAVPVAGTDHPRECGFAACAKAARQPDGDEVERKGKSDGGKSIGTKARDPERVDDVVKGRKGQGDHHRQGESDDRGLRIGEEYLCSFCIVLVTTGGCIVFGVAGGHIDRLLARQRR